MSENKFNMPDNEQALYDKIMDTMVERARNNTLVSEADFLAGAALAATELLKPKDKNGKEMLWKPAAPWIFMVLGGRSVVAMHIEELSEKAEDVAEAERLKAMADRIRKKQDLEARVRRGMKHLIQYPKTVVQNTVFGEGIPRGDSNFIRSEAIRVLEEIDEYNPDHID